VDVDVVDEVEVDVVEVVVDVVEVVVDVVDEVDISEVAEVDVWFLVDMGLTVVVELQG